MEIHCHDVTHAFYASYVHEVDFAKLKEFNVPMFQNFLLAIDQCSKVLERVVNHTGGKVCVQSGSRQYTTVATLKRCARLADIKNSFGSITDFTSDQSKFQSMKAWPGMKTEGRTFTTFRRTLCLSLLQSALGTGMLYVLWPSLAIPQQVTRLLEGPTLQRQGQELIHMKLKVTACRWL